MAKKVIDEVKDEVKEAKKPRVMRFSNADIYALFEDIKAKVEKERNLRYQDSQLYAQGLGDFESKPEGYAVLDAARQRLSWLCTYFKVQMNPPKAY